uniref:Uncharacterized protein n=1 Tax=Cacopsylla melanoneura TaxID=428564 RepID=A0A8D9E456_9HEMI
MEKITLRTKPAFLETSVSRLEEDAIHKTPVSRLEAYAIYKTSVSKLEEDAIRKTPVSKLGEYAMHKTPVSRLEEDAIPKNSHRSRLVPRYLRYRSTPLSRENVILKSSVRRITNPVM